MNSAIHEGRRVALLVHGALMLCLAVTALPGAASAEERPGYQVLRQREDWSVLARGVAGGDLYDPVKYIALSEDGELWLSLGAQLRERVEAWDDFGFGARPSAGVDTDDIYLLSRLLVHADLHLGRYVRVFAEGKSALATDRDLLGQRRTLEVDELDLQNGFLEIKIPFSDSGTLTLHGGREELLFGKQRLVSPLDWSNTRRTFDGGSGALAFGAWSATGFFTHLVTIEKYDFNSADEDIDFGGIYASGPLAAGTSADLYWLALENNAASFAGTSGEEDRHTLGARLWGPVPVTPFDYEVEGAYQLGRVGSADIDAFMIATVLGLSLPDLPAAPRLELAFDYASGDETPGDGDVETFNQLFPLGHAYLGYIDLVGRQNIMDLHGTVAVSLPWALSAKLDGHWLRRPERLDALYNAGGGVVRAGAPGTDKNVGGEIDLTLKRGFGRHLLAVVGYSHFFAGEFLEDTGAARDIDFGYLSLQYTI